MAAPKRSRGHRKRSRTRQLLLDAGARCFARVGLGMKIRDVVGEAEVATGTFYNHFENMEAFIACIAEEAAREVAEVVASASIDDPARRFALATLRALLYGRDNPVWSGVCLKLMVRPGVIERLSVFLRADLEAGHAAGRFTAPADDLSVDMVCGMLTIALLRFSIGSPARDLPERVTERLLLLLGLSADEVPELVTWAQGQGPHAPHAPQTDPRRQP